MKQKKIQSLQVLRGLAFLGICLGHFGDRIIIPSNFAGWGVTVFFVLSGFLNMLHGYSDHQNNKVIDIKYAFYKIRKLYPLILITTIVSFILDTYHYRNYIISNGAQFVKTSALRLLTNLLLISNWFPKSDIFKEYNIVIWFISTLFLLYFFTPLFIRIIGHGIKKKHTVIILQMASIYFFDVLLSSIFWAVFRNKENAWWFIYENPLIRVWEYLLGMFLASSYIKEREETDVGGSYGANHQGQVFVASCLMTALMWLIDICKVLPYGLLSSSNGFFYTIPTLGLIYSLSVLDENIKEIIQRNLVVFLLFQIGELSGYAYLLHVPVINASHALLKTFNIYNSWLWCGIAMTIVFVFSKCIADIYCYKATKRGLNNK